MSRYRGNRSLWTIIAVAVIAAVLAIFGFVYRENIVGWFKGLGGEKSPTTSESGGGNTSGSSQTDITHIEDFELNRVFLRYTQREVGGDTSAMSVEYNVPHDLALDVANDDNKIFFIKAFKLSEYKTKLESGMTSAEMVAEWYEADGKDKLDFTSVFCPEWCIGEDDKGRNVLRSTTSISYDSYNTRIILLGVVGTKNGDSVTFECAGFNGRAYDDWSVSPSLVYLASAYLNQLDRLVTYENSDMRAAANEIISKGIAQAKGVAEADYVTGQTYELNKEEVQTVKVGETKQLNVAISPDIDVEVLYVGSTFDYDFYDNYDLTFDGKVTGKKAGLYDVIVLVCGVRHRFTLEIVEA